MQIFHLKIILLLLLLLKLAAQAQVGETTLLINYVRKHLRRGNICVFKYILIYY